MKHTIHYLLLTVNVWIHTEESTQDKKINIATSPPIPESSCCCCSSSSSSTTSRSISNIKIYSFPIKNANQKDVQRFLDDIFNEIRGEAYDARPLLVLDIVNSRSCGPRLSSLSNALQCCMMDLVCWCIYFFAVFVTRRALFETGCP